MKRKARIYPILLAAGATSHLGFPKPLAPFGDKTALQIAIENCSGLARPIVVLGHQASKIRAAVPPGVRVVVNRRWRSGQLASLLAGLRWVPPEAPFMLYPVDYPLLTVSVIRRLVSAFRKSSKRYPIVVPTFRHRQGHPVIFGPEMRSELASAQTASEVVGRRKPRVKEVAVGTPAIWQDFDTSRSYRRCLQQYCRRSRQALVGH